MNQLNILDPENASAKRLVVFIVGVLLVAFGQKLGINLTENQQMELTGLVVAMLLGSNLKAAAEAKAGAEKEKARALVLTREDALKMIADSTRPTEKGPQP